MVDRGHYLAIQPWKPKFNPKTKSINKLDVWVRVTNMFTEYMRARLLKKIGDLICSIFMVDINTINQSQCHFARVYVQLDLNQPLETSVCIDGVWFALEYEGLSMICFERGKLGHFKEECLKDKKAHTKAILDSISRQKPPTASEPIPYILWIQVLSSTKGRKRNAKGVPKTTKTITYGAGPSRFAILEDHNDGNVESETTKEVGNMLQPIENIPKEAVMITRSKRGKNKSKSLDPPKSSPKGLLVSCEGANEKKTGEQQVKENNENLRSTTISNMDRNDLDQIHMEVSQYTVVLAKIPCNIEVNSMWRTLILPCMIMILLILCSRMVGILTQIVLMSHNLLLTALWKI